MKQADADHDIRELFQAARRAEESEAPSFDRVVVGSVPRPRSRARPALVLAGLAATVVVAVAVRSITRSELPVLAGIPLGSLTMPTDFLLNTPGAETLRSIPSIGTGTWALWPERTKGRSQ